MPEWFTIPTKGWFLIECILAVPPSPANLCRAGQQPTPKNHVAASLRDAAASLGETGLRDERAENYLPQHFLYFRPLAHGQGSLRPGRPVRDCSPRSITRTPGWPAEDGRAVLGLDVGFDFLGVSSNAAQPSSSFKQSAIPSREYSLNQLQGSEFCAASTTSSSRMIDVSTSLECRLDFRHEFARCYICLAGEIDESTRHARARSERMIRSDILRVSNQQQLVLFSLAATLAPTSRTRGGIVYDTP